MGREQMDPHFSVFNGHVNDADKRAKAVMRQHFPRYFKQIEEIEESEGGIMAIFDCRHFGESCVAAYAALVTAFVNEDADPAKEEVDADQA